MGKREARQLQKGMYAQTKSYLYLAAWFLTGYPPQV